MAISTREPSQELLDALDKGELSVENLKELIEIEAAQLGLTVDEAIERARKNTLPKGPLGTDLQFNIIMLITAEARCGSKVDH